MYSALMIPVGVLPYFYHICGTTSMWIVLGCNLWMQVRQCDAVVAKMNAKVPGQWAV